ncbi:hypothetical protein ACLMJK_002905 [Lecanora helva]
MTSNLPIPNVNHGQRFIHDVIDDRAQREPNTTWLLVPVDENNLQRGFEAVTFARLANAVNRAAQWLKNNLPQSSEPFQSFAYTGPKDLRYPIFAIAAGKLGKVMIIPSPHMTSEAQVRILSDKNCTIYVHSESMASMVETVTRQREMVLIEAPDVEELFSDTHAGPSDSRQTWDSGKNNPWLVFNTSGTTGHPKPITYTHRMMAIPDIVAGLTDIKESNIHHYAFRRWYTPLPALHFAGMLMVTSINVYLRTEMVLGPSSPPSPEIMRSVIEYAQPDGALMPPALIDQICQNASEIATMQKLKFVHYCGAPLAHETGAKIIPFAQIAPSIGSTEAGGYFIEIQRNSENWDYVAFQKHTGAQFERRIGDLHELVFVRKPEYEFLQQIFMLYPTMSRYETSDLWVEHPARKGLWRIVGRTDDYVYLSHGDGLHASTIEPYIERHELVQTALVGGHGQTQPVVLIELLPETLEKTKSAADQKDLLTSLQPYLDEANLQCHPCVQLSQEQVLFGNKSKPFARTVKGSVARAETLQSYGEEIRRHFDAWTNN